MFNKIACLLFCLIYSVSATSQSLGYTPPAQAAFLGSGGTWSAWTSASGTGALTYPPPAIGLYCQASPPNGPWTPCAPASSSGTVTSFSSGNLSPLFTTSVATSTSTPALSFTASTAAQNSVLAGPATGGTGAYSFRAIAASDIATALTSATTIGSTALNTALTLNGTSNSSMPGLESVVDNESAASIVYGSTYFAPNIPNGGAVDWVWGKANTNGNAFVLAWNQTASTATNNWCLTTWGLGSTCNLQGFLSGAVKSAKSTLDDGSGNMAVTGTFTSTGLITAIGGATIQGDTTTTPSTLQQITSTNTGSTSGIPVGYGCFVGHTFVSGANYTGHALCVDTGGNTHYYASGSHALGSEAWNVLWSTAGAVFNVSTVAASNVATAPVFESTGTKFTISGGTCATPTTLIGGASAGKFTLGTVAGQCTVTIKINGATGFTANNGYSCNANDESTVAGNTGIYFVANTATTATLSVPATAATSDVIDFACTAF